MDIKELNAIIIKGNKEKGDTISVYEKLNTEDFTVHTEEDIIGLYEDQINIDNIMNGGDPMVLFTINSINYYYYADELQETIG